MRLVLLPFLCFQSNQSMDDQEFDPYLNKDFSQAVGPLNHTFDKDFSKSNSWEEFEQTFLLPLTEKEVTTIKKKFWLQNEKFKDEAFDEFDFDEFHANDRGCDVECSAKSMNPYEWSDDLLCIVPNDDHLVMLINNNVSFIEELFIKQSSGQTNPVQLIDFLKTFDEHNIEWCFQLIQIVHQIEYDNLLNELEQMFKTAVSSNVTMYTLRICSIIFPHIKTNQNWILQQLHVVTERAKTDPLYSMVFVMLCTWNDQALFDFGIIPRHICKSLPPELFIWVQTMGKKLVQTNPNVFQNCLEEIKNTDLELTRLLVQDSVGQQCNICYEMCNTWYQTPCNHCFCIACISSVSKTRCLYCGQDWGTFANYFKNLEHVCLFYNFSSPAE